MKDSLILRSSISSQLMKKTLFKGIAFSLFGLTGLLYGGVFANLSILQAWGFTLYLMSLGCITLGMLPYRRLSRLQLKPNELRLRGLDHIEYVSKGCCLLTIPFQSIDRTAFVYRNQSEYGIVIWLKSAEADQVIIHQGAEDIRVLRRQGQEFAQADLFFPYFNKRAYEEFEQWQKEEDVNG